MGVLAIMSSTTPRHDNNHITATETCWGHCYSLSPRSIVNHGWYGPASVHDIESTTSLENVLHARRGRLTYRWSGKQIKHPEEYWLRQDVPKKQLPVYPSFSGTLAAGTILAESVELQSLFEILEGQRFFIVEGAVACSRRQKAHRQIVGADSPTRSASTSWRSLAGLRPLYSREVGAAVVLCW